jgi:hypothetical protein
MRTQYIAAVVGCGFTVSMSAAGLPVYTDESAFLADLASPSVTDGYENHPDDVAPGIRNLNLDHFDVAYIGTSFFGVGSEVNIPAGIFPIEGDKYLQMGLGNGTSSRMVFQFDSPIEAFGTYISDLDVSGLFAVVALENGQSFVELIPETGNGGQTYFGVQSLGVGIESVEFSMGEFSSINRVLFDQTTISMVPSPGVASVLAIGLLGTCRRRR